MSDPINLSEVRAVKAEDCTLWTAADALRATLRDVEAGKIKPDELMIWYIEKNETGDGRLGYALAGLSREGHVYLLNHALKRVLEECTA